MPAHPPQTPAQQPPPRPARHTAARSTSGRATGLLLCALLLAIACLAGIWVGARAVGPTQVLAALTHTGHPSPDAVMVTRLRAPRVVIGLLAGAALAVAGALVQAVTRNPLADPGILGSTSGAAFAVALTAGLAGVQGHLALLGVAFAGAALATTGVYLVGSLGPGGGSPVRLVLAGTALGAVLAGTTSAIVLLDPQRFAVMQSWRAGSLANRGWGGLGVAALAIGVGLLLALGVAGSLNAVALGDDLATSLGANVLLVRTLTITAVTLLAGTATAVAGPIAFVGLVVPHLARRITGPDQRWIMVHCLLLGPALLLGADVLGRVAMPPGELPAGIVTAFLGAPVLIALARRGRMVEL